MVIGSRTLVVLFIGACIGSLAAGQGGDPNQYDYTVPARVELSTATLSGLVEAYEILEAGINDSTVTGDKREMILLHVLVRLGMVVFDTNDAAVTTSLLEIAEPFGFTITGDKFMTEDPDDPNRIQPILPFDPNDPNDYYELPPGVDLTAPATAINNVILPELESIIAELAQVTESPTPFSMILTPAETGRDFPVEVDRGEVLALRAALLAAKAALYGLGHPAYDLLVDPASPLFTGWERGELPESTTINAVLNVYPQLLEIVPLVGQGWLAQAKQHLITALDAAMTALDYIAAETDDQANDLLYLDANRWDYVALGSDLAKFRNSLASGGAATYTVGSRQTYTLSQAGQPIGEVGLEYELFGRGDGGWIQLSNMPALPGWWDLDYFDIYGTQFEGGADAYMNGDFYWAWFTGTISADGSQITNLAIQYVTDHGANGELTGLSAQRTGTDPFTLQFNPNPLYAGSISPRDMLPQFDPNTSEPIPGTMGHGAGDDPTLAGIFPTLTQQDWIPYGYEVWGGSTLYDEPGHWMIYSNIDQHGYTKLGESDGDTATFSGNYPYYVIAARGRTWVESVQGSDGSDYNGMLVTGNTSDWQNILGAPNNRSAGVGYDGFLELFDDSFSGYAVLQNPGNWTGLTVTIGEEGPARESHDWNGDGIVSIVGDVPPFVDCVYFGNCPADVDTATFGDCNGDGIVSIIGDVPCFVDCVYFGNCPD